MSKCIEIEGVICIKGQQRSIELHQVFGTGQLLSFQLVVDGQCWGAFFKGRDEWISQDNLTKEEKQSLAILIEQAFLYDRLDFTIKVPVGDETRTVNVFETRPGIYVLTVNKWGYDYHRGRIWKQDGLWTGEITHGSWNDITGEDLQVLGDIIEEHKKAR